MFTSAVCSWPDGLGGYARVEKYWPKAADCAMQRQTLRKTGQMAGIWQQMVQSRAQLWRGWGAALVCLPLLAACQAAPRATLPDQAQQIQVLRLGSGQTPPQKPGQCWAQDIAPAVIETITQQIQSRPERRDGAGNIVQSAQFQTRTDQRMVQDRAAVWFEAPCPADITVAFVASLQRALKARGEYTAPITGAWDNPTLTALRRYQRARGLDSAKISLATARELGLSAAAF